MTTLEQSIDVNVPAEVAWAQLHRMDSYPQFIEGLQSVEQRGKDQAHLQIRASGNPQMQCDTEIMDRRPNEQMTWRITNGGPKMDGSVELRPLDDKHCKVQVRLEYDPKELSDSFGLKSSKPDSAIKATIKHDLEKFKSLVERRSPKS
ncbi:MAG: cyclase [Actinomycetia bacterium]|nr:cyclase [Actinomycetes bacterium]